MIPTTPKWISKALAAGLVLFLLGGCSVLSTKSDADADIKTTAETTVVEPESAPPAIDFCAPEQGAPFSYRKKVAILAADLQNPLDARDLPGLGVIWSQLLQQRFSDSGRLLVVDASKELLYIGDRQRDWVVALAKRLDVQFVIAVRFHNLRTNRARFGVGDYSVPLPRMRRQIEAELMIFDGQYGSQVASIHHGAEVDGGTHTVYNSAKNPVMRGAFLETKLGVALQSMLDSEVEDGLKKMACMPLMARVIKVAGENVYISTRGASLIRPGDTLQLFRTSGVIENRLGPIEIIKVFPESAVGVYKGDGAAPSYSEGLRVRAW